MSADSVTHGSFFAKWNASPGANQYSLDVSTDPLFSNLVSGYDTRIVSSPGHVVVGLNENTDYYFRLRAIGESAISDFSPMASVRTITSHIQIGTDQNPFAVTITPPPPSPEAAALAKYADVPVSLYTGIPNVSIPIYEIKEHGLTLPISMNYHGGGNKVETVAPRTGLGWTLDCSEINNFSAFSCGWVQFLRNYLILESWILKEIIK